MKHIAVLLVLLLLVTPVFAQEKTPIAFSLVQTSGTALTWCDFVFTTWALKTGDYAEINPLASFYVDHTAIAIPIVVGVDLIVNYGLRAIYQDNKTLAWIMLIVFTGVRCFILYHNLRII